MRNFNSEASKLFQATERAATNLSETAIDNWKKPAWIPQELNDR